MYLDDDVRHAVAHGRGWPCISFAHSFGKLDMGLLALVVVGGLAELFGDDQLGDVNAVAEQLRDGVLDIRDGPFDIALDQQLRK